MSATPSAPYRITIRVKLDGTKDTLGAVTSAIGAAGGVVGAVDVVEMDEKSLRESAALKLPQSSSQIDIQLNAFGATVGRPWRKEQKASCLAAWVAAAAL